MRFTIYTERVPEHYIRKQTLTNGERYITEELKEEGYNCSLCNARFVKPIDEEAIEQACKEHKLIVTLEENVASGGYGEKVRAYVDSLNVSTKVLNIAIPDEYVEHGNVDLLKQEIGIDAESIVKAIQEEMEQTR